MDGEILAGDAVLKVLSVYFTVSVIALLSGYLFQAKNESVTSIPVLLSVLLIIPVYLWLKTYYGKIEASKEIDGRDKIIVLSWLFGLFILAMAVRLPSVLLFGMPYEKTPLIYLVISTIVIIEKTDVSTFGFKFKNVGKSLLSGFFFFATLNGLNFLFLYFLVYAFTGQTPVKSYNILSFLLTMPFMTLCVGISEEGLFRGYIQTHLEKLYTSKQAIFIQAVLFGVWHFVWDLYPFNPIRMIFYVGYTFLIGLLFGYFYSKTRNLTPLVFAHGLFNSIPQWIIRNQLAFDALQTVSLSSQVLTWTLPYIMSIVATFLFIKYSAKEI